MTTKRQLTARLVLGIVDEYLFMKLYNPKILKKIDGLLRTKLGNGIDTYMTRFDPKLNPSATGVIKQSLWEQWLSAWGQHEEPVRYIIMCNTAWSGIALYEAAQKPSAQHRGESKDKELENAASYVVRWLPRKTNEDIGWFFPIFDRDDLNDIGLISALLSEYKGGKVASDRGQIFFARFNYRCRDHNLVFEDRYGAYAQVLANKVDRFDEIWKGLDNNKKAGMEMPDVEAIPFVFSWSHLIEIYEQLESFFSNFLKNAGSLKNDSQRILEDTILDIGRRKKMVHDPKQLFYEDLVGFHAFIRNLPDKVGKVQELPKPQKEKLKTMCENATEKHSDESGVWLETDADAQARFTKLIGSLN